MCCEDFPARPWSPPVNEVPSATDAEAVRQLIGREPLTGFRVAARCPHGAPAVIENDPVDDAGRPFPTRYWLVCRALGTAVSRLEAAGGVSALDSEARLAEPLNAAHERHRALHNGYRIGGVGDPLHTKCLHAQLAFGLATGGGPVTDWIWEQSGAAWPAHCCKEPR